MVSIDEYRIKLLATNKASPELVRLSKQFEKLGGKDAVMAQKSLNRVSREVELLERKGKKANIFLSRFTQGIAAGNIAANAATAILRGLGKAMDFVGDSILLAARVDVLDDVFLMMGQRAGYTTSQLKKHKEEIIELGITEKEALGIANRYIQSRLDLADATKIARIAQDAAVIAGVNSSEAAIQLTDAIVKQRPILLKQFGIVTDLNQIYNQQAKAIGKTRDELTELEKRQGFVNEIVRQAGSIAGAYDTAMGKAGKQLTSLPRHIEAFEVSLGNLFQGPFSEAIVIVTKVVDGLTAMTDALAKLSETKTPEQVRKEMERLAKAQKEAAESLKLYNQINSEFLSTAPEAITQIGMLADMTGEWADNLDRVAGNAEDQNLLLFALTAEDIRKNIEGFTIAFDEVGQASSDATNLVIGGLDQQAQVFRGAKSDLEDYSELYSEIPDFIAATQAKTFSSQEDYYARLNELAQESLSVRTGAILEEAEIERQTLVDQGAFRIDHAVQMSGILKQIGDEARAENYANFEEQLDTEAERYDAYTDYVVWLHERKNQKFLDASLRRMSDEKAALGQMAFSQERMLRHLGNVASDAFGDMATGAKINFQKIHRDFMNYFIRAAIRDLVNVFVPKFLSILGGLFDNPVNDRMAAVQGADFMKHFTDGAMKELNSQNIGEQINDGVSESLKTGSVNARFY